MPEQKFDLKKSVRSPLASSRRSTTRTASAALKPEVEDADFTDEPVGNKVEVQSTSEFRYEPRDIARTQIRLVRFFPHDDEHTVFFKLETHDLHTAHYRALSYVWGDSSCMQTILEQGTGKQLLIRKNLYDWVSKWAKSKRNLEHPLFWIDQISIDQSSVQERNHQVGLMGSIYSHAAVVHAWLGKDIPALPLATRTNSVPEEMYDCEELFRNDTEILPADLGRQMAWFFSGRNKYWTRLWILQEILLARVLIFEFNRYIAINAVCQELVKYLLQLSTGRPYSWSIMRRKRDAQVLVADCWYLGSDGQCEDLRDKVFGLQGLLAERDRIAIDYTKASSEVYVEALAMLIIRSTEDWLCGNLFPFHSRNLGRAMNVLERSATPSSVEEKLLGSDNETGKRQSLLTNQILRLHGDNEGRHVLYGSEDYHRLTVRLIDALWPLFTKVAQGKLKMIRERLLNERI